MIKERNLRIREQYRKLYQKLEQEGFKSCLLKGQSFGILYQDKSSANKNEYLYSYRQSGDIDLWMLAEPNTVINWACSTGSLYYFDYHYADVCIFQGVYVELYYHPSISRNLIRNKRLQKWFCVEGQKHIIYSSALECNVPDITFCVLLALNHNFWHLLYEGIELRQMMDLYFCAVAAYNSKEDTIENTIKIRKLTKSFELEKFAAASAWGCPQLFEEKREQSFLLSDTSPLPYLDEISGRFLLNEIIKAGNLGHYDERLERNRFSVSRINLMRQ